MGRTWGCPGCARGKDPGGRGPLIGSVTNPGCTMGPVPTPPASPPAPGPAPAPGCIPPALSPSCTPWCIPEAGPALPPCRRGTPAGAFPAMPVVPALPAVPGRRALALLLGGKLPVREDSKRGEEEEEVMCCSATDCSCFTCGAQGPWSASPSEVHPLLSLPLWLWLWLLPEAKLPCRALLSTPAQAPEKVLCGLWKGMSRRSGVAWELKHWLWAWLWYSPWLSLKDETERGGEAGPLSAPEAEADPDADPRSPEPPLHTSELGCRGLATVDPASSRGEDARSPSRRA